MSSTLKPTSTSLSDDIAPDDFERYSWPVAAGIIGGVSLMAWAAIAAVFVRLLG